MPSAEVRTAMREEYVRVQSARAQAGRVPGGGESPVRTIKDPYPSFAGVSVDPVRNEVVFTDESLFQVLVYDRMENTPAGAAASKPKRVIVGEKTNIEFQSSAWVDPEDRRNLRGQQRHPRYHRRLRRRRQRQCGAGAQHSPRRTARSGSPPLKRTTKC